MVKHFILIVQTSKLLIQIVEHELLATRLEYIVDLKEFEAFFDDQKHAGDLKRAFTLFTRVKVGHRVLADCYGKYVRNNGKRMVQKSYSNTENMDCLIEDLLQFVLFVKQSIFICNV